MDNDILEILKRLEVRQNETYQIVKALEHSAEVNKSEHDNMTNDRHPSSIADPLFL